MQVSGQVQLSDKHFSGDDMIDWMSSLYILMLLDLTINKKCLKI
jgi:hypothetical protein